MAGRKRRAVDEENNDNAPTNDQPQDDRRQQMAQIARRRAAHFATFDDLAVNSAKNADNPHVGSNEDARNLGPWSSAVALANAREQQRSKRDEKILQESRNSNTINKKAQKSWTPSRDISLGHRITSPISPLSHLALRLIVDLMDQVETLWGLPDMIKTKIAHEVCARRALTPDTFKLFTEHSPNEVCLPDCTQLDADVLSSGLLEAATPRLEKLHLGYCGRGFTDATAMALAQQGVLSRVVSLRISGGYRLSDDGVVEILRALSSVDNNSKEQAEHRADAGSTKNTKIATPSSRLEELSFVQCSRIEGSFIKTLVEIAPCLKYLDLSDCRGLSRDVLIQAIEGLASLEHLILESIPEVDDTLFDTIKKFPSTLRTISLRKCGPKLTDRGITVLVTACPQLCRVRLDECSSLTNESLLAMATHCSSIEDLSLSRCYSIDDQGICAVAAKGTLKKLNVNSLTKVTNRAIECVIQHCKTSIEEMDVSWCRDIPCSSLGLLADSCPLLRRLVLWGCTQADDTFLFGHSNDALEVVGRGEVLVPVRC